VLFCGGCLAAELREEARIEPSGTTVVGETRVLYVDVLTDTWFSSAPQMPTLELDGVTVSPSSGEARHLNLSRDGRPFFGLEFSYRITPTRAGEFVVPSLRINATVGQLDAAQGVETAPQSFTVEQPAGVESGQSVLVARNLTVTQNISQTRDSLGLGDSVSWKVSQTADGAEMMLLASPLFPEIDGLKRYVDPPQLKTQGDGRGSVTGGERIDVVHYVVQRGGNFQLPAISLEWWDSGARQLRSVELPAHGFTATDTAFSSPFSVQEDLRRFGGHARVSLMRHWLVFSLAVCMLGLLVYLGMPWARQGWQQVEQAWRLRDQRRHASAGYAFTKISGQLKANPPRLDALYLWVRRRYGETGLGAVKDRLPADLTRLVYGRAPRVNDAITALTKRLATMQSNGARLHSDSRGLRPLNPRYSCPREQELKQ
jgi:hypothetical protein